MAIASPELMLTGVFVGILICVLAMMALKLACPPTSVARGQISRPYPLSYSLLSECGVWQPNSRLLLPDAFLTALRASSGAAKPER
jgi:hypothetical protein